MELYRKFRPSTFDEVYGQDDVVRVLSAKVARKKVPHAMLMTGPSGTGKTTLLRIVASLMGCNMEHECKEKNCADYTGIDSIRDIRSGAGKKCFGSVRVFILDEVHQLTKAAQSMLLKELEDPLDHVYFMLATTDPQKLLPTIKTRCTEFKLKPINDSVMSTIVKKISKKAKIKIKEEVQDRIVAVADGSARKAIVLLDQVMDLRTSDEQLEAIESAELQVEGIKLCRALINPQTTWAEMATLLKGCTEDPEQLRRGILGYASSVLLGGSKIQARAYLIIKCFGSNFYDAGRADLIASCYEVIVASKRK